MLFQQGTISVDERFARFGEKSYAINKITSVEVRSETKKGSSAFLAWWLIALTFAVSAIATLSAVSAVFALIFVGVGWTSWKKRAPTTTRSEEHTSELQSLMRISSAVFCLKKKKHSNKQRQHHYT